MMATVTHDRSANSAPMVVQRALRVGSTNDPAEAEADTVADRVMRMPAGDTLQRCACGGGDPDELRRQSTDGDGIDDMDDIDMDDVPVQAKAAAGADGGVLDTGTASRVVAAKSGGQPLAPAVRQFFEPRFGTDLSHIRTHADPASQRLTTEVNARAFTTGQHIFFGPGEHATAPTHLLAHELTHTLQQTGRRPGRQMRAASPAGHRVIRRRVQASRVSCRNAVPGSSILTQIGTNDPVGVIQAADAAAITMLDTVIDTLVTNRDAIRGGAPVAWPTIGDATARALRDRLGLDPNDRTIWTGNGARTVNTVIRRFQAARRLLVSGGLRYRCLGSTTTSSNPGCTGPDCSAGDDASTCSPSTLISLCAGFWAYNNATMQGLTLLHEALHIYFGFIGDSGHFANAGCYDQFVADLHGIADQGVCP